MSYGRIAEELILANMRIPPGKRAAIKSRNELRIGVNGVSKLTCIPGRCGTFLEPVAVPDCRFASIGSHLEILRQFQAIGGAGVLAQPAEHAPRSIVSKIGEDFAARGVVAMPAHHDQLLRA